MNRSTRVMLCVVLPAALVVAALGGIGYMGLLDGFKPDGPLGYLGLVYDELFAERPLTPKEKAEKDLAAAHSEAEVALANRLEAVRAVFNRGRRGSKAFAGDALSWDGKWALIKDKLGIGDDNSHAAFLSESFSRHIFTGDDLKSAMESAIRGYASDLDRIENELLVRLRADLSDGDLAISGNLPALASDKAFQEEYQRLAESVLKTMDRDLEIEPGRQVASLIAMDIATPIVIRIVQLVAAELGVEAGILSTGAVSGVATLGIGLIVGIVADQVISFVLKKAGYDPEAQIASRVRQSLGRVETLVIEGTKEKPGLRDELLNLAKRRASVQDAVVGKFFEKGGDS